MSLPTATTTISVLRQTQPGTLDAIDLASVVWSTVSAGVRAVLGSPSGSETVTAGSSETVTARLACDPVSVRHGDRIYDEQTATTWDVTWTARRYGLGLDHVVAELVVVHDRAAI